MNFRCTRYLNFMSTLQHKKPIEKKQEHLILKIKQFEAYARQPYRKRENEIEFSNEVSVSRETKI